MDFINTNSYKTLAQNIKGQSYEKLRMISNGVSGSLHDTVLSCRTKLKAEIDQAENFWAPLVANASNIGDQFIERTEFSFDTANEVLSNIDTETAETFRTMILVTGTACEHGKAVMVSDANGLCYSIAAATDVHEQQLVNECQRHFAEVDSVLVFARTETGAYPLMYRTIDDQVKLNPLVPTSMSHFSLPHPSLPTDVLNKLLWACDDLGIVVDGDASIFHVAHSLEQAYDDVRPSSNICDCLRTVCHELYLDPESDTIDDMADAILEYAEAFLPDQSVVKGNTIWDIVSNAMDSIGINRALLKISESLLANPKGDLSSVLTPNSSNNTHIQQVFDGAIEAWYAGGFSGVASYVISFFKTAQTVTDKDGYLIFTDNNAFVPQQYIAGMIASAIQVVSTIAATIISAFGSVIGFVVYGIGQIVGGIIRSIQYSSEKTNCGIQEDLQAMGKAAPWAFLQGTETYRHPEGPDDTYWAIAQLLDSSANGTVLLTVPGGFMLIGRGPSYVRAGRNIDRIRWEFHPAVIDSTSLVNRIESELDYYFWAEYEEIVDGMGGQINLTGHFRFDNGGAKAIEQMWVDLTSRDDLESFSNEGDGEILSDSDDLRLFKALSINVWCFSFWITMLGKQGGFTDDKHIDAVMDYTGYNPYTLGSVWDNINSNLALCTAFYPVFQKSGNDFYFQRLKNQRWIAMAKSAVNWNEKDGARKATLIISDRVWLGDAEPIIGDIVWGVVPAKYDGSTFWKWFIIASIVTTVAAVTTLVASISYRRWARSQATANKAAAERAWSELTADPSNPEKIKAYRKAVRKNNLMSKITGGSAISKTDYWSAPEGESQEGSLSNTFRSNFAGSPDVTAYRDGAAVTDSVSNEVILGFIRGFPVSNPSQN